MLALKVDDEELIKRILHRGENSGRSDDNDTAIIRKRIEEYNAKTAPLANYFPRLSTAKRESLKVWPLTRVSTLSSVF